MAKAQRDTETDQRLRLLVGLVVVGAGVTVLLSLAALTQDLPRITDLPTLVSLVFVAAVGAAVRIPVRIRSSSHLMSWTETAIVLSLAIAPTAEVVLCTALGAGIAQMILRLPAIKGVFNVSKNVVVAGLTGLVFVALGYTPQEDFTLSKMIPLAIAYAAAFVIDQIVALPVIARATHTPLMALTLDALDIRVIVGICRYGVIVGTLAVLSVNRLFLAALPLLALSLHLVQSNRMRARESRKDWERLARTTEALNVINLGSVIRTATTEAAELFSANEVEVELRGRDDDSRLIRGNGQGIAYDGPLKDAPPTSGHVITGRLDSHGHSVDVGVLTLRFHAAVSLSELEIYKFRTFASALSTAIRNAQAYAELQRLAAEHAHDAAHDALTGLANRRQLMDRGNQILESERTGGVAALLLIDLNHFKEVNDTLGHGAGDLVLIQLAERLRRTAHAGDLVARLGGDEFAILMTGLSAPAVASHRADALIRTLHEPMDIDGMRISVEASGGIAPAPSVGGMPEILRRADVAMYQAKRSGRRVSTYSKSHDTADVGRLTLGGDLSRAMAEQEFTVNFQPIVDLASGQVIAAEALARWHHPEQGTIDPLRFLETVERSELLPAFAEAVLDQSLIAASTWREAGFDLPVAVNVSPRSLLDARFPGSVLARLRAHDVPPDKLILELTETLTISQLEVVDRVLGRLRDEGVRLALDDFGTGYSSLSVLSRIPVNELKIDREFVTAMETSAEAAAVIRSTVDLGRSLDLAVVAEGVESEPQRLALWELGCNAGQGHLFARPMAAPRLLAALHRGSGGRPGTLAPPLHEEGSVIRFSPRGRPDTRSRTGRLPHSHP